MWEFRFLRVFYFCALLAVCYNSCPLDKFGPNCEFKCNCLRNDRNCGENGCQNDQCIYGYMDPPECQTRCPKERFGVNCMFFCNCPDNDSCNLINGMCSSNKCKDGFGGAGCQKRIPFLSNPPVVEITDDNKMLVSWKPWPRSPQSADTPLMMYSLQATMKSGGGDDDDGHKWFSIATIKEQEDSEHVDGTLVKKEPFDVVPRTTTQSHHRMKVLFRNPEMERHYKFRILVSLMREGVKTADLEPSPVTPKWHAILCRAPSVVPTDVRANTVNSNNETSIHVYWETPIEGSICSTLYCCHEVLLFCRGFRHGDNNNSDDDEGIVVGVDNDASISGDDDNVVVVLFNVTWPLMSLDIFNASISVLENDYKVKVRVLNKRGLVGSWSDPVSLLPIGEVSIRDGNKTMDLNSILSQSSPHPPQPSTFNQSTSFDRPSSLLSTSSFPPRSTSSHLFIPSLFTPSFTKLQFTLKLVERNETHVKLTMEGKSVDLCRVSVVHSKTMERMFNSKDIDARTESCGDDVVGITIGGLEGRSYYDINVSCHGDHIDTSLRISTGFPAPPKPNNLEIVKVTQSTVEVQLPLVWTKNGDIIIRSERDLSEKVERSYVVVVEKIADDGCCLLSHLIKSNQITKWDKRISTNNHHHHHPFDLPNFATSEMYGMRYYQVVAFNEVSKVVAKEGIFTIGDGKVYGEYGNPPLSMNTSYVFWFAIEEGMDGLLRRSFSRSLLITMQTPPSSTGLMSIRNKGQREVDIVRFLLILIIIMLFVFFLFGVFMWRWFTLRKKESMLSRRLLQAKLMSHAYLNREGFRPGATKLPGDVLESNIFSSTNPRSINPFTFPPPFHAFSNPLDEDFVSPIPVKDLRRFCERFVSARCDDDQLRGGDDVDDRNCPPIWKEFDSLPSGFTDVIVESCLPEVMESQLCMVFPYKHNQVKLKDHSNPDRSFDTVSEDAESDEGLNASRVRTIGEGSCIVTQTLTDQSRAVLWQIVQQESITHVIDLDSSDQSGLSDVSCSYYPRREKRVEIYGDVDVELMSTKATAHYTMRILLVGKGQESRFIHHWNYHTWTSYSTPSHQISFLDFLWKLSDEVIPGRDCSIVQSCRALVHCNHGDGREGIFLALDALVAQGRRLEVVDIKSCVVLLRSERHNIVKFPHQYSFVHECLAEVFDHPNTRKSVLKFIGGFKKFEEPMRVPAEVAYEHKLMMSSSYWPLKTNDLSLEGFVSRGPQPSANAGDRSEQTSLNFVSIDGLERRKAFLVQNQPISWADDVEFWRIVTTEKVSLIIMVEKMIAMENGDSNVLQLFTMENWNVGGYLVSCLGVEKMPGCSSHKLSIIRSSSSIDKGSIDLRDHWLVDVIQLDRSWGRTYEESLQSLEAFVQFVHLLRTNEKWDHPMMLVGGGAKKIENKSKTEGSQSPSMSGVGMFALLWSCVEQGVMDGVVDVFERCRLLRSYLPNALDTKEEYHLVCLALRCYLGTYPDKMHHHHHHHHHHNDSPDEAIHRKPPTRKCLNILSIPLWRSPYKILNTFRRKTKHDDSLDGMDLSGSYRKFSSPHASPSLVGRLAMTDALMMTRGLGAKPKRPCFPRQHRFFDSIKRDEAPQMIHQIQL